MMKRFAGKAELPAALLALLLLSVGVNTAIAPRIEAARIGTDLEEELALYPSGRFLGQITAGFRHVAADLLDGVLVVPQDLQVACRIGIVFDPVTDRGFLSLDGLPNAPGAKRVCIEITLAIIVDEVVGQPAQ